MTDALQKAASLLGQAKSICVLTGAGISAESGLQTFRDAGGLWENHSIEAVATPEGFERDPRLVWAFYNARRKSAYAAKPNPAHQALAKLEKKGSPKTFTLLTQNIDGLHQAAGNQAVVELHGSLWKVRCTACARISHDHPIELPILPSCQSCGELLRPHIVWFGEGLDESVLDAAEAAALTCDLFLVIGTSALVQPAASFPMLAVRRGKPVLEVNKEETSLSEIATLSLRGLAGEILPKII